MSTTKLQLLSPFKEIKYAASALLLSMKPCIFLIKFGSLTALFPASVGKIARTRTHFQSILLLILYKEFAVVKISAS